MATKSIIENFDAIDGTPNAQRVKFSFKHLTYSIDLGPKNHAKLLKVLQPFMESDTKTSKGRGGATTHYTERQDLEAIRKWARSNGYTVSDRGRVKTSIVAAYDEAKAL